MTEDQKTPLANHDMASCDIVYQELYEEMRRYRDYELSVATWYTAILAAIFGVLIAIKPQLDSLNCVVKSLIVALILLLGISSLYSICYAHKRYNQRREIADKLEPGWNTPPPKQTITPRHLICITLVCLVIFSIIVLFI